MAVPTKAEKLAALANADEASVEKVEAAKASGEIVETVPVVPPAHDDAERVAEVEAARVKAEADAAAAKVKAEEEATRAAAEARAAELERAVDFGGNVTARVLFGRYAATVNGRYIVAVRGQLVKGSAAFIARGVKLKGLEEA